MRITTIYALTDQIGNIRYIGQTRQKLYKRKSQHKRFALVDKRNGYKDNWIRKEYKQGREINIKSIEECIITEANDREEYWIKYYKRKGCKITNTQAVGRRNYKSGKSKWNNSQIENFRIKSKNYIHNTNLRKPILKYSLDGIFLKEYESVTQLIRENNIKTDDHNAIKKVCIGIYGQAYGFIWRYKSNDYPMKIKPFIDPRYRSVVQCDLYGNPIKKFNKIKDAIDEIGLKSADKISLCCKGIRKTCGGFKWKYVD